MAECMENSYAIIIFLKFKGCITKCSTNIWYRPPKNDLTNYFLITLIKLMLYGLLQIM